MADKSLSEEAVLQALNLGGLVKDWGGFEKLVAELNLSGNVSVEHNVVLIGKSGAPRQTDVVIRHREGLIDHLVIVECKHWQERVGRTEIDALASAVSDLNASRGVLFSVRGFESGAVLQAKSVGIDLFTVRELTDQEWGAPGRHVELYLQVVAKSIRNLGFPGVTGYGVGGGVNINFDFGETGPKSQTLIEPRDDTNATTLETLFEATSQVAGNQLWKPAKLFDGASGKRLFWKHANIGFKTPIVVPRGQGRAFIPNIEFDLGLEISQSYLHIDRGARYAFVLAIEDCVRGITKTAARPLDNAVTVLSDVQPVEPSSEPVFQNGSILTVWLRPFYGFEPFTDLVNGEIRDVQA